MSQDDDHGQEMFSPELESTLEPNISPGAEVVSTTRLLVRYSEEELVTIPCTLNTLDDGRVDVDNIPVALGVLLFKRQLPLENRKTYTLETHGQTFELGCHLSVYGLFADVCSISFRKD